MLNPRCCRRTVAALTVAGVLIAAPPCLEAQDGCRVFITANGRFKVVVNTDGPVPVVEFDSDSVIRPVFELSKSGNDRLCEESLVRGSLLPTTDRPVDVHASRNASDLLLHLANGLRAAALEEYASTSTEEPGYRDLSALAARIWRERLGAAAREVLADIATDLISRFANPASLLTDKGAKYVVSVAVKLMIEHYVEGRDPGLIIDGLLENMVDYLTRQAQDLVKAAGPELSREIKALLETIAAEVKTLITERLSDVETISAEASSDHCTYRLEVTWPQQDGGYRGLFDKRCGRRNFIETVVVNAPAVAPGQGGEVTAQALNEDGVPLPLADASITGLAAVMPDGSAEPAALIAGGTATFKFQAARPRRDGRYPVRVTLTTDAATGRLRGQGTDSVVVENVAPRIESTMPGGAGAEPGRMLELTNVRVTVVDDNADRRNPREVSARTLALSHPSGLRTTPRFDRPNNPRQVSFDPQTGTYVVEFSRSGRVERPHEHDTWPATITLADDYGAMAEGAVELEVEDAAPSFSLLSVTPQFVHTGDGKTINITGRLQDTNGAADIVEAFIDATAAGGDRYVLGDRLLETGRGDEHIDVRIDVPFGHVDPEDTYPIPAEARDEKNTGKGGSFLHVGNEAPEYRGSGYIHGGDPPDFSPAPAKGLCPGESFRVGMIARDPEGDPLTVTATIVETGDKAELTEGSQGIYTGELTAPARPGQYTLLFEAKEKPPGTEAAPQYTHPLQVNPCGQKDPGLSLGSDEVPQKEFVIGPGEVEGTVPRIGVPPKEGESVGLVPKRPVVDVSENPTAVNAVDGRRDPAVQMMILESLDTVLAFGNAAGGEPDEIEAGTPVHGPAVAVSNAGGGGQDLRPGEIRIFLTSLGSSTGEAIEAYAFTSGAGPVALAGAGLVLEPLDAAASARAQRLLQDRLQGMGGAPPAATRLNAYCLEFLGAPPDAGAVFRLAPAEVQRRFAPARRILHAAEQLRDAGRLSPDSDATAYFHAIRQWAIWAEERNLDLESFGGAFVERTRENLQRMGQAWSDEIERDVRARVPGRWRDIRSVLEEVRVSRPPAPNQGHSTDPGR